MCAYIGGSITKDVIKKFDVELLQQLPLDDTLFCAMARRADLFPLNTEGHIRAKPTRADKVDYFLQNIIKPGADEYLPKLLEVMRKCDYANVVKLADNIQAALAQGK